METINKVIKTFTFLDESGALVPIEKQHRKYFGIGILKHTQTVDLISKLHPIYETLCSELKKDKTQIEFSFKRTTSKSIKYDIKFLETLEKDFNWEFNCLYFNTEDKLYQKPNNAVEKWERYVSYSKLLIRKNLWSKEETVLIADYLRKPTVSLKKFEYIVSDIDQVYNAIQLESHGVLLTQAADLLLGGYLYSLDKEAGDKEGNKTLISEKVLQIKEKVGKKKFNCWEMNWSRNSRAEGV